MSNNSTDSGLKSSLTGIVVGALLVGALLGVLIYFDVHLKLIELLEWIDDQGIWAAVLFIGVMALVVVFILPGIFFTMGAGYVFGIVAGVIYVVIGTTLGAAIAFLIARHMFGERARKFVMGKSKLSLVNDEMTKHDFKVVLLTRLIPLFPGKLSNYFFGLTNFNFWRYVAASLIGYIPFTLHNVYLGSLVSDLTAVGEGGMARSPAQWALYACGFIATVVAIIYFNSIAKKALEGYTAESEQRDIGT
ncbi:MAG: TVP38/TMEM64 family protein [Pseudomonadota bacterium]